MFMSEYYRTRLAQSGSVAVGQGAHRERPFLGARPLGDALGLGAVPGVGAARDAMWELAGR